MPEWAALLLWAYYATLGILALFGVHRAALVVAWWRTRKHTPPPVEDPDPWPVVTVQLPIYNERYVARRLLEAVAALDYPPDRLEIQVLDDSTDDTTEVVAATLARLAASGLDIRHLHRDHRQGYKAGALAAGMESARGELLCIFDADFVPPPDFLRRTVPYFADPGVGMVQARWEHLNRDSSLLTWAQAVLLDGHFVVEHAARHRSGCFFNFNGTAGVWRRQAIVEAGGWQSDTLTEDLDLSYRAQLAGWRFLFLSELAAPAELPADINAFKGQQHRWARGAVQTGRKLLPTILRAHLPLRVKLEALVHLTNNLSYPLMVVLAALVFPAMLLRRGAESWKILALDLPLFAAATLAVLTFYAVSQLAPGGGGRRGLRYLPAVLGTGIGLSVSNAGAVLGGLVRQGGVFNRTPKVRSEGRARPRPAADYRLPLGATFWVELALALYFLVAFGVAVGLGMWASLPFLFLFLHGYAHFSLLGLVEAWRARRPAATRLSEGAPGW
jgi:cellulose synthase/poly-beta-1,6-N-acetylglucosamine synthase-like glycosyltransferase